MSVALGRGFAAETPVEFRAVRAGRPRPLAFLGRWGRARRWLPPDARRVADIGCSFAYGTVAMARHSDPPRWFLGIEYDAGLAARAHDQYGFLPLVRGDAMSLPLRDGSLDAVSLLDVIEHVADPAAVLAEVRRVLRPGGALVLSVPHQGPLAALDGGNAYRRLRRRFPSLPELEVADQSASGWHRHFSVGELREMLSAHALHIERVARTGVGAAELVHIALLLLLRAALPWRSGYLALRHLYFGIYLIEDVVPAGPLGYHLTVRARAV